MRHKYRNSNLSFVFGVIAGLLCVMTVGYAAFSTNLNIKVKGNIVKKEIEPIELKKYVVTSGDGLYKDTYEENRYVYKGKNPNNYITFNNEIWRIIALESDGTLKITKQDSIGNIIFDTANSSNWANPATLNTYLNGTYFNKLSNEVKSLIQNHAWGIGSVTQNSTDVAALIAAEKNKTWTGNIGLISVSDVIRANTNITECGDLKLNNLNSDICKTTNYLVPASGFYWTISPNINYGYIVFCLSSGTYILPDGYVTGGADVHPTLYMTSNIILSGKGTEDKPYTIILK